MQVITVLEKGFTWTQSDDEEVNQIFNHRCGSLQQKSHGQITTITVLSINAGDLL